MWLNLKRKTLFDLNDMFFVNICKKCFITAEKLHVAVFGSI